MLWVYLSRLLSCFPVLWTDLCPPKMSYADSLSPNVAIFGDGTSKKVIKIKLTHSMRPWSNRTSVLIKEETPESSCFPSPSLSLPLFSLHAYALRKGHSRTQWQGTNLQAKKPETEFVGTWSWFPSLQNWETEPIGDIYRCRCINIYIEIKREREIKTGSWNYETKIMSQELKQASWVSRRANGRVPLQVQIPKNQESQWSRVLVKVQDQI